MEQANHLENAMELTLIICHHRLIITKHHHISLRKATAINLFKEYNKALVSLQSQHHHLTQTKPKKK